MKINCSGGGLFSKRLVKRTIRRAQKLLKQPNALEVEISFVDQQQIQQLNNEFLQRDKPTDVLSFPALTLTAGQIICQEQLVGAVNPMNGNVILGEIVICKAVAQTQAQQLGHSLKRELAFLALHGFLHLLGYDHIDVQQQQQMIDTQDKVLNSLGILRK